MQKLLDVTLSLGNSAFFNIPKGIVQSFVFEDVTKFDSLNDMNELALIREEEKVKCMNETANEVIYTNLFAVSVQPTTSEQECCA